MRILLLTHSFNHLSQRLFVELRRDGHEVSVEFDIHDSVTREALESYQPDVLIAPFLKRKIPEDIWSKHLCLIVHPGIIGDRGPSALDWAILNARPVWGVTVLKATGDMDAGDIYSSVNFPMRNAPKSSIYRIEVADAALTALREALQNLARPGFRPLPLAEANPKIKGELHPLMTQENRRIHWQEDSTEIVLRKIRSADSYPGVLDSFCGEEVYLFNAKPEDKLKGLAHDIIATRHGAICVATSDGAVWITHLKQKQKDDKRFIKLPATQVLAGKLSPELENRVGLTRIASYATYQDIYIEEYPGVAVLNFDFLNGAMKTEDCERLQDAYLQVKASKARVIMLCGGKDFWSNGIHLGAIEAAESAADESWRNINAINDFVKEIIDTSAKLVLVAMRGPAAAGAVFAALAADHIIGRGGIVLNPHYKNMGNLYGSEYWTYLLPRRLTLENQEWVKRLRLPIAAATAKELGLIDQVLDLDPDAFDAEARKIATDMANAPDFDTKIAAKQKRRTADENLKPLAAYRAHELDEMRLNFYGCDPSYHVARYNFVYRTRLSRTPLYLASHRRFVAR